jgi:hypothetical protein
MNESYPKRVIGKVTTTSVVSGWGVPPTWMGKVGTVDTRQGKEHRKPTTLVCSNRQWKWKQRDVNGKPRDSARVISSFFGRTPPFTLQPSPACDDHTQAGEGESERGRARESERERERGESRGREKREGKGGPTLGHFIAIDALRVIGIGGCSWQAYSRTEARQSKPRRQHRTTQEG